MDFWSYLAKLFLNSSYVLKMVAAMASRWPRFWLWKLVKALSGHRKQGNPFLLPPWLCSGLSSSLLLPYCANNRNCSLPSHSSSMEPTAQDKGCRVSLHPLLLNFHLGWSPRWACQTRHSEGNSSHLSIPLQLVLVFAYHFWITHSCRCWTLFQLPFEGFSFASFYGVLTPTLPDLSLQYLFPSTFA